MAIKIPRKGQLNVAETEQFLREARAAAQLRHPNIVSVHEVGREDDVIYIVSDFIQGITLADWLTAKRPTPKEAAELMVRIADAVQHAHDHGVIHRDLKPTNVLVARVDRKIVPKVIDFGVAKAIGQSLTSKTIYTRFTTLVGTPAYMSPEQAEMSQLDVDTRSDIYSLGVILYELVAGATPLAHKTPTSLTAPKRFLMARTARNELLASPSK